MADNLTLEFKRQLEERTKLATERPSPNLKTTTGGSLWESAAGKEMPAWMSQEIEDEQTNVLTAVGKGLWTAFDITGLGIPGLAGRAIGGEAFTEAMEPKTFAERVTTGIGGAAGFIGPMAAARGVLNAGVRTFARAGTKKFAQSYSDDAIKMMRGDKEFMGWVNKKVRNGEIEGGKQGVDDFLSSLVQDRKDTLLGLGTRQGEAMFARTAENRMNFAKNFNENTPKILRDTFEKAGYSADDAARIAGTLGDDLAKKIGTVLDDAGGTFKFPMTQMHQVLAAHMGNGKLGNLAAHALEEAILFSAVELPLNFMNSLANDEVDFSLGGTLSHSFVLGSALGVIRFIPGGSDYGIIRPAWNRITKTLETRRRYRSYDVKNEADRLFIGEEAKRMFSMKKESLRDLTKTVEGVKGSSYKIPIHSKTDIDDLVKTSKGAQTVKDSLIDIETALYKSWYPKFLKEIPGDVAGSSARMLTGALAFNWSGIEMMSQDGYPLEDIIFNVALGMFMTKKGKPFEYVNRKTGKVEHLFDDRPYTYTKELEQVDTWLNQTNTAVDAALYRALFNEHTAIRRGFTGVDESSRDMQKLLEIAEKNGLVVEKYVSEDAEGNRETRTKEAAKEKVKVIEDGKEVTKEVPTEDTFSDEIYTTFAAIVEMNNLKPRDTEYEVKEAFELTKEQLNRVKEDLNKTEFDALEELKPTGRRGVETSTDILDIVLGSAENQAIRYREMSKDAVIDIYNEIHKILNNNKDLEKYSKDAFDLNERIILQPLDFSDNTIILPPRHIDTIHPESFLMRTVSPYYKHQGEPIRLNQEMVDAIFGKYKEGKLVEPGVMDKHDRSLTEMILEASPDTIPVERWQRMGDEMISGWTNLVLNRKSVRQHWRAIKELHPESNNKNDIFESTDYAKIQKLMPKVFNVLGELADSVQLTKAGRLVEGKDYPREYNFINKMLTVLRNDLSRNTGREKVIKTDVTIKDVQDLMKLVDKTMPIFTMPGGEAKNDLINQMADYTLDRSISSFQKSSPEGQAIPLDSVDRRVVKYLIDQKIVSPQMTMLNIKGVIDNNLIKMVDWFRDNKKDVEAVGDVVAMAKLLKSDPTLWHQISGMSKDMDYIKQLSVAAEQSNMSIGEFIADMHEGLNNHLYPLIKESGKKGGFINLDMTPQGQTHISAQYLAELKMTIDLLKESSSRLSHQELFDATADWIRVGKSGFNKQTAEHRSVHSLMKNIQNLYLTNPSSASIALKTLVAGKLFDRTDNQFKFDNADKNMIERIKDVEETLNMMFQVFNSDRDLKIMWEKDRLDSQSRYPVDTQLTIGLNKYISRYNIDLKAEPGTTLGISIGGNTDVMKNPFNFYDYMRKKGASIPYKGDSISQEKWGLVQYRDMHEKFVHETLMVYSQLKNNVTVNKIKAFGNAQPKYSTETFQKNDLYNIVKDLLGEFTLIDTKYKRAGREYDIALDSVDNTIKTEFFAKIANQPAISAKGGGDTAQLLNDLGQSLGKQPYAVAFVSNMKDGIGIPYGLGVNKYIAIDRVTNEFINIVDARIKELGDYMSPDAISTYKDWRKVSVTFNEKTGLYEYTRGESSHQRVTEDMTMMLNNIFGDKAQGREYWESVSNDNWNNAELFANKQLRYMKLLSNRSSKEITEEYVNDAIDLLERLDSKNNRFFKFLGEDVVGDKQSVKSELKKLSKKGWKAHILGDESPIDGEAPPMISSLFQSLSKQIKAESELYNSEGKGLLSLNDFNTENLSMPGGLGDVSRFDSVNIVTRERLNAINFLFGLHGSGVEHLKAVGASSSNGNAVFLDKTAWITDRTWDKYLERHKIDMVIMDSANKMSGTDITGEKSPDGASEKVIYMSDFNSMSDLIRTESDLSNNRITLPINTFSIASAVKPQKSSTLPLQVANDFNTPKLNNSFYEWQLVRGVRDFITEANTIFGDGKTSEIATKLKINFDELDVDTDQMAMFERWISHGGDPTYIPFKRTVRNQIKSQLIDKRNLLTPRNEYGSQSVVVPDFTDFGTKGHLRNTLFKTEWLNGERSGNPADIVSRNVWTYGQIEIDATNKGKLVAPERIRFIEHNYTAKDKIVRANELSKEIQSLLDGKQAVTLNDLYRSVEAFNDGIEGKRYEIALVAHRTPTTRSSDKVIVGLKGFGDLTGNAARINHADGWFRLEMDFDIDKINYWWDTPSDILRFWDSKSGEVPSVKGTQQRTSIHGLNPFNGKALMNYNFSEANSSLYRGIVVKAKNTIQFLKSYRGANYTDVEGFNIKLDRGRIVLGDADKIKEVEYLLATDIQRIVDAGGRGYDKSTFDKQWESKLLFGDGETYPGIFSKQTYDQKTKSWVDNGVRLDKLEQDMVGLALTPYKRFLGLRTSVFESGEQKKVDYDTLIDYTQRYSYIMSNLNRYVYWGLRNGRGLSKNKWSGDDIDSIFKEQGRFVDPFRLRDTRFDDAVSGVDAAGQNTGMIAADRMIANLAGMDRMSMKKVNPDVQYKTDGFIYDFLLGDTRDVDGAVRKIVEGFSSDFDKLNAINSIDYRMRRYRRSQRRMERNGNHEMASSFGESHARLRDLKSDLTKEVMASKSVQKAVRTRILRQIYRTLASGGTWTDKYGKTHDFSKIRSRSERFKAIEKIKPQITSSIWDTRNKQLGLKIRGVNSDDYAQILATYNVLSRLTGVGLNPATVEKSTAMKWEQDIRQFKGEYGKKWWELFNNRLTDDMDANSVMNEAIIKLEKLYYDWEGSHPGLGKQFVLSLMTPKISTNTVTYHNGTMMPGFNKVNSQTKFITLGLRFFERLNTTLSDHLMIEIAKPISNQLAWLRGEIDPKYNFEQIDLKNYNALSFKDSEGGSPLIEYESDLVKKVDTIAQRLSINESLPADLREWKQFEKVNENVLNVLGLTGDLSLDYISYKLPGGGLDLIANLSSLVEMRRIPRNALTMSGKIVPVHGINSYFRHKMNQVKLFYGQPHDGRNLFTGRKESIAGDIYGGPESLQSNRKAMKRTSSRHGNENGIC
tara:strand:+ start:5639 stop:14620 length:8982 start_codon:yes stop_codon:yes gene_type:complete